MYQALPYKAYHTRLPNFHKQPPSNDIITIPKNAVREKQENIIKKVVNENAIVVIGRKGCCMCHVVTRLLTGLGVNPAVHEVDEQDEVFVMTELIELSGGCGGDGGGGLSFPVVFVGGKWFGGLDRVMATHITGELTPILRQAGALWL